MTGKAVLIPIRQDAIFHEPTLDEILADPITRAVMRADRVDLNRLGVMLQDIAERLDKRVSPMEWPHGAMLSKWTGKSVCWLTCS